MRAGVDTDDTDSDCPVVPKPTAMAALSAFMAFVLVDAGVISPVFCCFEEYVLVSRGGGRKSYESSESMVRMVPL